MIVREVARDLPDHVDGVVLFGSPIIGGPMHTIAARAFDPAAAALATAALEALDTERFQRRSSGRYGCRSPAF